MAKNFFKRYIWLVDLINRRKYVSFKEINEAWMRSPLNETGDPLSERTFFNHKDAIAGMFGIEILNDRSLGFYIGRSDVGSDETSDWMLHTLCLNNVLHENADMKDRILMEKVPSSERFLTDIISAMRDFRVISLCYQSFRHPEPFCFNVRPYCVKYFKQRWYLLGDSDLGLRIYSLDRFVDMEELEEHFEIPKGFDAEEYFGNYFGVIIGEEPEDVKIRVGPDDTDDAPVFPFVWEKIEPLIEGLPLVAHNSRFDEGCLKSVFKVYQMDYPDYEFFDTLAASRRHFGCALPNHQLQTVAAACGYDLTNHHHALADAEACAAIAMKIL